MYINAHRSVVFVTCILQPAMPRVYPEYKKVAEPFICLSSDKWLRFVSLWGCTYEIQMLLDCFELYITFN